MQTKRIIIINDCFDANARLRIEAQVAMAFPSVPMTFYNAEPFATLALSFLLAEAEFSEGDVVLFNAAPRKADAKFEDNRSGEMVFVTLKTGGLLVGPNEGSSLTLIRDQIDQIYTKKEDDGNTSGTQFRSAYVFPKSAAEFIAVDETKRDQIYFSHDPSTYPIASSEDNRILWIDSFDNLKLSSCDKLEVNKIYSVRFIRDNKFIGEVKLPYREKLTLLAPGELGLITGSSFQQKGLEIARRTGVVGLHGARAYLLEQNGFLVQLEDEVQII